MTAARLSPLQRQVLEQLAHIRVAPKDAWMTTKRLQHLAWSPYPSSVSRSLRRLEARGLVEDGFALGVWRITDKGREALG